MTPTGASSLFRSSAGSSPDQRGILASAPDEPHIGGVEPGAPATYMAMGHLHFDSVDAFEAAFGPHAESLLADIPNYTNTQPVFQISDVRI